MEFPIAKHTLPMSCTPEYMPSNIKLKTRKCSCSAPCEITDFMYPRPVLCSCIQCDADLDQRLAQLTSGLTVTTIEGIMILVSISQDVSYIPELTLGGLRT